MERAGRPRHRSHNPRGEGERAGCERINFHGWFEDTGPRPAPCLRAPYSRMALQSPMKTKIQLRDVEADDLPLFFEHQRDPIAVAMVAFNSRDRAAFDQHWAKLLADDSCLKKTIVVASAVSAENDVAPAVPAENPVVSAVSAEN